VELLSLLWVGDEDDIHTVLSGLSGREALRECLQPEMRTRAHEVAGRMRSQGCVHGARIAAERLTPEFG
jgi:predicted aldo/keto reductase-like oxidoreductase